MIHRNSGPSRVIFPTIIVGVILLFASPVLSQTDQSAEWGTAARGMAGAYTAAGGNLSGISYNPANSATIRSGQFVTDFNQLSQRSVDVQNGAIGGAYRIGNWVHGLAFNRTDLGFDFGNFGLTSNGLNLDYSDDIYYYNTAWNITPDIHLASNLKYFNVSSDVQGGNATGYGMDLGYMQFIGDRTTLGLSVKNLVGDKDWDSGTSEDIPLDIRAGLRYRLLADLAVEADAVYGEDPGLRSLNVGGEWWLWKRFQDPNPDLRRPYFRYMQRETADRIQFGLALRGGLEIETAGSENTNLSLGMGMQFGNGHLDYAFQQRSDFDNQHFFGFSSTFGGASNSSPERSTSSRESYRSTRSDIQTRQSQRQAATQSSFGSEPVQMGLLQWQTDPGVGVGVEDLQRALGQQSGLDLSVYSRNDAVERALIDGRLSNFQAGRLLEESGKDYLITGEIRQSNDRLGATVVIQSSSSRETFQLYRESPRQLIDSIADEISSYLESEQRVEAPTSDLEELPVPYSVRVGLLHWNIDRNINFDPTMIQESLRNRDSLRSKIYRPNKDLEQSILHNALSSKQYRQLLENSDNDYLVTGQITRLESGYLATAYLVNAEERKSINVMHSELDELVNQLTKRIEQRVTG